MRGINQIQNLMFSYLSPEERVPAGHPLRDIKRYADEILRSLSGEFEAMYSKLGWPSVPPERLLKAQLLMALYSVRSDRMFCEMLDYNILFRWFLDMSMEEGTLDATTFTKNRERILEHEIAETFFKSVVDFGRMQGLLSDEHFTVDGSLIEACAILKSFRRKGEEAAERPVSDDDDKSNPSVNFRGETRKNDTHCSTTDPESLLMRKGKGKEARLSYDIHALMENRNGLLTDLNTTKATGDAERTEAMAMMDRRSKRPKTLGGDKGYDTREFVKNLRSRKITPHVAANVERKGGSAIDGRTTRHAGYAVSQRIRKKVEEIFGWLKTIGGIRRTRFRGLKRTHLQVLLAGTAYNLMRIANLLRPKPA